MREFIRYGRSSDHDSGSAERHPVRDTVISHDDFLNLKIALETNVDVMEFIEDPHIFD